jgi:hypothetical protein
MGRLAGRLPGHTGDAGGFTDGGRGGLAIAEAAEVLGVVEQAVGQVVGGGMLAQPGDRCGERRAGVRARLDRPQPARYRCAATPGCCVPSRREQPPDSRLRKRRACLMPQSDTPARSG